MKRITATEIATQYEYMDKVRALAGHERHYFVRTFGCQQNEADSEQIAGMCEHMGYLPANSPDDADLIVVNTCAVREHAELRALSVTGQYKKLKARKPELVICICGCMVTQDSRITDIKRSYPYVDLLFGTGMLHRFPELLYEELTTRKRRFAVDDTEGCIAEGLPKKRESRSKAWVSVMYGCNNFCTYCVVPYVRGRERSRNPSDILDEVRGLVADGCREITLLGQNVNSYGRDLGDGYDFADLVSEIDQIDGDFIIRFMTSHPKDANRKLIDVMASSKKCARQFHLPLQSGSERVLRAMNRRYTPDEYLRLIEYMREKLPNIAISSDIIVGFPGESDDEFNETLELLSKIRFDMIFSFIYSPRVGTPAAKSNDQIPEKIKSERMNRLLELQNQISYEKNLCEVGKVERVLLEGESRGDSNMLTGRADSNKLVHIPRDAESERQIGEFVKVKITRAEPFALIGELEN